MLVLPTVHYSHTYSQTCCDLPAKSNKATLIAGEQRTIARVMCKLSVTTTIEQQALMVVLFLSCRKIKYGKSIGFVEKLILIGYFNNV